MKAIWSHVKQKINAKIKLECHKSSDETLIITVFYVAPWIMFVITLNDVFCLLVIAINKHQHLYLGSLSVVLKMEIFMKIANTQITINNFIMNTPAKLIVSMFIFFLFLFCFHVSFTLCLLNAVENLTRNLLHKRMKMPLSNNLS